MQAHLREVCDKLDEARRQLRSAIETVPEAMRGQPPGPDRWSANQVLEHLSLVERRFAAIIAQRISEAREAGLGPEQESREAFPAPCRRC
jgi:uncharacterized damage-inducible protein DinB